MRKNINSYILNNTYVDDLSYNEKVEYEIYFTMLLLGAIENEDQRTYLLNKQEELNKVLTGDYSITDEDVKISSIYEGIMNEIYFTSVLLESLKLKNERAYLMNKNDLLLNSIKKFNKRGEKRYVKY